VLAVLLFALDVASDFWLHRAATRFNEEPGLNERASRDLGRRVLVEEAIVGGRGRVRLGDTLWMAQGPDLPVGTCVRIVGRRNSVLMVEPAPPRGKS
ncbi:MAG: NfeD family protein, partial [Hyphomicrobiaceae bacterium]